MQHTDLVITAWGWGESGPPELGGTFLDVFLMFFVFIFSVYKFFSAFSKVCLVLYEGDWGRQENIKGLYEIVAVSDMQLYPRWSFFIKFRTNLDSE